MNLLPTSSKFIFLTALALTSVCSTYAGVSAREVSEIQRLKIEVQELKLEVQELKMSATEAKTILMAAQMAGGIQWNKPASTASIHAKYVDSAIAAGLTDVLAVDAKENEVYSSASENNTKLNLSELLRTHRSSINEATHFSLDTGSHSVTMVAAFGKKGDIVGYIAMAWAK